MQDAIIEFVQDTYSVLGISVKSYGKDSILLSLPHDCTDISSVIVDLVNTFDVSIDFQIESSGPILVCWYNSDKRIAQITHTNLWKWAAAFLLLCCVGFTLRLW